MEKIKVLVADLLKTVKANREKHITEYNEAIAGYRTTCIAKMKENLAAAEAGDEIKTGLNVARPESHEKDYDRAISMLTWTQDTIVELGAHDFDRYVNDDWAWQQAFKAVNSMYLSSK